MKKFFIIFIVTLLIVLYGCKNRENKPDNTDIDIKIIDYTDSVYIHTTLDYNPLKYESKKDDKAKKHLSTNSIFGLIDANYSRSIKTNNQFFYCDVYSSTSPKANIYLDTDGRIVKYQNLDYKALDNGDILSQEELIDKANHILSNYVNVSEYNIEFNKCDQLEDCYEITYTKYIGEIRTADYACVTYDKYGQLVSFNSSYLGMIDKSFDINRSIDEIKNAINGKVDIVIEDIDGDWDKIEYNDYVFLLVQLDMNDYALICDLDLSLTKILNDDSYKKTGIMLRFLIDF